MFKSHQKLMVLQELTQADLSGYDLLKRLGEIHGKKPSPGHMYPLLHELTQNKLVSVKQEGRRKVYSLTAQGKKFWQSLSGSFQEMQDDMMKSLQSVTSKEEFTQYQDYNRRVQKQLNRMIGDMDLVQPFQDNFLKIYEKNYQKKRKSLRKLLVKFTKELARIR